MATPQPTRTLGPLHLEDLEPHRFEDLVRQLVYDFRRWSLLEATGRAGSDEGYDVRAYEEIEDDLADALNEDTEDEPILRTSGGRTWLIQCKREKAIGAAKLKRYMEDIPEADRPSLHGVIFAAAADFSKASRDAFFAKAREHGYREAILWGKAEIEDLLFQPKNDHLLFAYFGVSLQVRRRSLATQVRSRLAAKRKVQRHLGLYQYALLLDASDDRYPYLDGKAETMNRHDRGRWRVFQYTGQTYDGIEFTTFRQMAALRSVEGGGYLWDVAERTNDALASPYQDPWGGRQLDPLGEKEAATNLLQSEPNLIEVTREGVAVLQYDAIIDIDPEGDDRFRGPVIYVTNFDRLYGPFKRGYTQTRGMPDGAKVDWEDQGTRMQFFARANHPE